MFCQQSNHTAGRCMAPPCCRKCSQEHKTVECMTRSLNLNPNPTAKPPTKTIATQTPLPKETTKPKTKSISTLTPPLPKEAPKQKLKLKSPTKENYLKPKTLTSETQTCPTKVKTETKKSEIIVTQTDPPVLNIPEIFEFPYTDADIEDPTSSSKKTKHKVKAKTKTKDSIPSSNATDYMDMEQFAQLVAQIHGEK